MLYITVFILFVIIFAAIYFVLYTINADKVSIYGRMSQIGNIHNKNYSSTENRTFSERAIKPIYIAFSKFIVKAIPSIKLTSLSKKLEKAGMLKSHSIEKWLYTKFMTALLGSVLSMLLIYSIEPSLFKAFIIGIILFFLINTLFNFRLAGRIKTRKNRILSELPYTLDLITVSVEAGLSFDGALSRVVSNIKGELCDEFSKCLKEIRMGIQRKTALKSMGERCEVKELSMLITSIIQADDLGVSLGKVLRIEAANLREHRKQIAREKAMKAPVKMLFPLIIFIFPSIFIIILGPAVIKIFAIFQR